MMLKKLISLTALSAMLFGCSNTANTTTNTATPAKDSASENAESEKSESSESTDKTESADSAKTEEQTDKTKDEESEADKEAASDSASSASDAKKCASKPEEDASGFVVLSEAVPEVILEPRYYSTYNFVGDRIDGYEEPVMLLSKEAAEALKKAAQLAKEQGYRLKIFDAYRPQMAVDNFVSWAEDLDDTRMKAYFYPDLDKSVLFDQGYIAKKSGHTRGSTLDLTLFDEKTGKEVDMGGTFDFFGELSHPDYKDISSEQYENRMTLQKIMTEAGFNPLATEWWHFTLKDEPYDDTYFTFPVAEESVEKVELCE